MECSTPSLKDFYKMLKILHRDNIDTNIRELQTVISITNRYPRSLISALKINKSLTRSISNSYTDIYPFIFSPLNLNPLFSFISNGDYWFNLSHLEFIIIPVVPCENIPVNNSIDYIRNGQPVKFSTGLLNSQLDTEKLSLAIINTIAKMFLAQYLKHIAILDQRNYYVDTGNGPFMATPKGKLELIPTGKYLVLETGELKDKTDINEAGIDSVPWYMTEDGKTEFLQH